MATRGTSIQANGGKAANAVFQEKGFIDNLLAQIHLITVMMRWTGFAP